jgi:hypothetical protein
MVILRRATRQNQSSSHHHGNQANEQNLPDFLHKTSFAVFPAVFKLYLTRSVETG